jgi:hypothetical protein
MNSSPAVMYAIGAGSDEHALPPGRRFRRCGPSPQRRTPTHDTVNSESKRRRSPL